MDAIIKLMLLESHGIDARILKGCNTNTMGNIPSIIGECSQIYVPLKDYKAALNLIENKGSEETKHEMS